jgi:beta-glucosidase-like glycosyl hydrolase
LVNGEYVCENNHTTNYILREHGGWKGWMVRCACTQLMQRVRRYYYLLDHSHHSYMLAPDACMQCSDYRGTRSTIDAANHGLDIAMPGPPSRPDYFGVPLKPAIKAGRVSEETITEKVTRIVYSLVRAPTHFHCSCAGLYNINATFL